MGTVRTRLRFMVGAGLSPGAEQDHVLPDEDTTAHIVQTSSGKFAIQANSEDNDDEGVDYLARLTKRSSNYHVVFEPLVDGIFIEPGFTPRLAAQYADKISVPRSSDTERHYIHLRPDDIINFRDDALKVCVIINEISNNIGNDQQPSNGIVVAPRSQTEVQVESSNAEPRPDTVAGDADDADDATSVDDDDLDQPLIESSKQDQLLQGSGEVGKSTPTAPYQTVMETPQTTRIANHEDNASLNEDNEPYSTAREDAAQEQGLDDRMASPTAVAHSKRTAKAESMKDSPLATEEMTKSGRSKSESPRADVNVDMGRGIPKQESVHNSPEERPETSDHARSPLIDETEIDAVGQLPVESDTPSKRQVPRSSPDYTATSEPLAMPDIAWRAAGGSGVRRRSTPLENGFHDDTDDKKARDEQQADPESTPAEDEQQRNPPDYTATSEYGASEIAWLSAGGSGNRKRRLEENENDEALSVSSKKQRTINPKVLEEQYEENASEGIDAVESSPPQDDVQSDAGPEALEEEREAKPKRKGQKANTRRSTRRQTKNTSPKEPEKPKSSPMVVVPAERASKKRSPATKSPSSSAASSLLSGKAPSVLLSKDSSLRERPMSTFLKKQGAVVIGDVKTRRSNFVCVLQGDKLTKTAKVLRSLALGKLVVTEDWITESKAAGHLLEPEDFVHKDLKPSIHVDRRQIFDSTNLFFTKTLVKAYGSGWQDIQELAKEAGASHIEEGNSGTFGEFSTSRVEVICFGHENDVDVPRLKKQHKVKVYHKNLLTQSIIKGELDLDGEEHEL